MKVLRGQTESITWEEAHSMKDEVLTSFLYDIYELVKEAGNGEDDDSIADVQVKMASKLGDLLNITLLEGLLTDPDIYLSSIPGGENARVEEICDE